MRMVVLGIAAIGVALAVACLPPAGKACTRHQECDIQEYCDPTLGNCVAWIDQDPSCDGGCGPNQYCIKAFCRVRWSVHLTAPQSNAVVPRRFDAGYRLEQDLFAPLTTMEPVNVSFDVFADGLATPVATASTGPTLAVEGSVTLTVGLDAAVRLVGSVEGTPSAEIPLFVDQTR